MYGRNSLPDCLPRLRTYAQALARYNETVPLRTGHDAGLVPLGDARRYKRSQMLKVDTLQGKVIKCRYWQHDCITFYEDGRVHFDIGHWHSPTTLMFLNDVFGGFARHTGKIYYKYGDNFYYLNPTHGLWLSDDGSPHEPEPESAYSLDRKRWKALTAKVKPFMDYAQNMIKVMEPRASNEVLEEFKRLVAHYGHGYWESLVPRLGQANARIPYLTIAVKEIRYNRGEITKTRAAFMERVMQACETKNLDAMYPLMFTLQACASEQRWAGNNYVTECSPERLKKYMYELMKFEYCNDIFQETVQPIGKRVVDSNAKYFTKSRTS